MRATLPEDDDDDDDEASSPGSSSSKRLHLVSDPGFLRRYLANLLAMAAVLAVTAAVPSAREKAVGAGIAAHDTMMATAHRYAWWSLLGLLASSCCALQLVLNALSLGCAGFNTVLGPFRPTLLAVATLLQAGTWMVALERPLQQRAPTLVSSVVVVGTAVLPELLDGHRKRKRRRGRTGSAKQQQQHGRRDGHPTESPSGHSTCVYRLDNIGCSSCIATVSNVLEQLESVEEFDVSLEHGGSLSVTATDHGLVRTRLEEAGFPMQQQPLDEAHGKKHR